MCFVTRSRASKSRRNSLTIKVIRRSWRWLGVAFGGGGRRPGRLGEHGQGGPAVPGGPAADLVLIDAGQSLGGLEGFLDAPALTGHLDQGVQGGGPRRVAAQVGQFAGGIVAADQQIVFAGVGLVFG